MSALDARAGYRLWASRYERETPVSWLEHRTVEALRLPTADRRLLDVGCGVARRLDGTDASLAIGVDLTPEMLLAARRRENLAAADARALPFAAASFDVVWCRLVVGHLPRLDDVYAELARVTAPGGHVLVTDFHPDAVAAGHRRTFRGADGERHEIAHWVHTLADHEAAGQAAGLTRIAHAEGAVGPVVRHLYAAASRLDAYEEQQGLRLVLALAWVRHG